MLDLSLAHLQTAALDGEDEPAFAPPEHGFDRSEVQLSLFRTPAERVVEIIRKLDLDALTPLEALNKLSELKEEISKEDSP